MVKNPPIMQVQPLGQEDSPREGTGNPFQYSCLENSMDRGAWWATVHRVTKSWTQLKRFSKHACPPDSERERGRGFKLRLAASYDQALNPP